MPKLNLNPPLINACGILSYLDIIDRLEQMGANFGAFLTKSIGPQEKQGNKNPTICNTGDVLLNSFALPTHPVESWIEEFEQSKIKKPIIGSVYGFTPQDYSNLVSKVDKYVSAWELNVSCPNIEPGETSLMELMSKKVRDIVISVRQTTEKPIIAKLSPNEDYINITKSIINYVDYIACGNTLGPGLVIDIYSKRPTLAGIYGGMSGPAIKPKTMKMVNDVYEIIKDSNIGIIAYGGITNWQDIIEYAIAGAEIFGIGTALMNKNSEQIVEFTHELWDGVENHLRERKTTLEKLVGTLKK